MAHSDRTSPALQARAATRSPNTAVLVARAGPLRVTAKVKVSELGILAIGGLVSGILLSTSALVWVATTPARRHPVATRLGRR